MVAGLSDIHSVKFLYKFFCSAVETKEKDATREVLLWWTRGNLAAMVHWYF